MFNVNWSQLQTQAESLSWYSDIVSTVQKRVDTTIVAGLNVPDLPGGWLHKYVCQETWMPLRYNPNDSTHHTSLLGKVYAGELFDGGWLVWRHRELADTARDAGFLYKLSNEASNKGAKNKGAKYFEAVKTILDGYAKVYSGFAGDEDAEAWMTKGRVFNQALSEAIWAVPIVQGFGLIQENLDAVDKKNIVENLLYPIADTLSKAHDSLIAQNKVDSNYVAWLIAAIGTIGFNINDEKLIHRSIEGVGGFKAHFEASILADGFQYEVTPYYHNFVALAFIDLAEAALSHDINLYDFKASKGRAKGQSISSLWEAMAKLTLADGTIPELNDGSYWQESIYDSEICDVYELALSQESNAIKQESYISILKNAYRRRSNDNNTNETAKRGSWVALLRASQDINIDIQAEQHSVCLEDSGFAVLQNNHNILAACIPFGDFAGSHSHFDRLAPSIYPFSLDAGTPLYGIKARVTWYQQSLAHNTVVVDKVSQNKAQDILLESFGDDTISLRADSLYDGVTMGRCLQLSTNRLTDIFELSSQSEHCYDWLCHTDGTWTFQDISFEEIDEVYGDDEAGGFVRLLAKATVNETLKAQTDYGGESFGLELTSSSPFELLLATCPGRSQHPHQKRHLLIARVQAAKNTYSANYKVLS